MLGSWDRSIRISFPDSMGLAATRRKGDFAEGRFVGFWCYIDVKVAASASPWRFEDHQEQSD